MNYLPFLQLCSLVRPNLLPNLRCCELVHDPLIFTLICLYGFLPPTNTNSCLGYMPVPGTPLLNRLLACLCVARHNHLDFYLSILCMLHEHIQVFSATYLSDLQSVPFFFSVIKIKFMPTFKRKRKDLQSSTLFKGLCYCTGQSTSKEGFPEPFSNCSIVGIFAQHPMLPISEGEALNGHNKEKATFLRCTLILHAL